VEVRVLSANPRQKGGEQRVAAQGGGISADPLQFLVAEALVQRSVADGVQSDSLAAAAALGHGMMIFDAAT
jgi:hypothetical protein